MNRAPPGGGSGGDGPFSGYPPHYQPMHGGDHGYGPPPPNQQHHPVSSLVSDRDWSRTARKSPDRYTASHARHEQRPRLWPRSHLRSTTARHSTTTTTNQNQTGGGYYNGEGGGGSFCNAAPPPTMPHHQRHFNTSWPSTHHDRQAVAHQSGQLMHRDRNRAVIT